LVVIVHHSTRRGPVKENNGSLQGFVDFYINRCGAAQKFFLRFALARMAKLYPDEDPQVVILEHLADWLHRYRCTINPDSKRRFFIGVVPDEDEG
jgi:hypothetical protein